MALARENIAFFALQFQGSILVRSATLGGFQIAKQRILQILQDEAEWIDRIHFTSNEAVIYVQEDGEPYKIARTIKNGVADVEVVVSANMRTDDEAMDVWREITAKREDQATF